jgi:hypothetical protein
MTVTCICLFIGAMGKSAQVPLHVWLPDSMEGPTPISALIHAATMVTAGIFMVSRMSPLFELSTTALSFVIVIGAITALFMGFLGIIQNDIKRVVAYSTLSQLGYMTVALGASAYSVAIFHLMTHAFFKALLFLGAGSVIIGMHHDQDIRNMGGLRKYMPITWITSLIGSLALIGTPFLSGFLFQGFDHRGCGTFPYPGFRLRLLCGDGGRLCDRFLLLPDVLPRVPWRGAFRQGDDDIIMSIMATTTTKRLRTIITMALLRARSRTKRPGLSGCPWCSGHPVVAIGFIAIGRWSSAITSRVSSLSITMRIRPWSIWLSISMVLPRWASIR